MRVLNRSLLSPRQEKTENFSIQPPKTSKKNWHKPKSPRQKSGVPCGQRVAAKARAPAYLDGFLRSNWLEITRNSSQLLGHPFWCLVKLHVALQCSPKTDKHAVPLTKNRLRGWVVLTCATLDLLVEVFGKCFPYMSLLFPTVHYVNRGWGRATSLLWLFDVLPTGWFIVIQSVP